MTGSNGPVPGEELRLLIERVERLEEEEKGLRDDKKDVYAEAKARGFDTSSMRRIVKLRRLTAEQRREMEAIDDIYKASLGMLDGTPLGNWAVERLKKTEEKPADAVTDQGEDELYTQARALVITNRKASVSWLQRQLHLGYNNAAIIIARLEREGVVSAAGPNGKREVLAPPPGEDAAPADFEQQPPEPDLTLDDARRLGSEAAAAGASVTSNPFPAFDERRAAWDEAWCAALGSDGMEIPEALRPVPKPAPIKVEGPKKGDAPAAGDAGADESERGDDA